MPQHGREPGVRLWRRAQDVLPTEFLRRDYPDEAMRGVTMQSSSDKSPRARGRKILDLDVRAARVGLYGVDPIARYVFMIR